MAATCFSMATAPTHKLLLSLESPSSSGGGASSCVKLKVHRLRGAMITMARDRATSSFEISHAHCRFSCFPIVVGSRSRSRKTTKTRASLTQEGSVAAGILDQQDISLSEEVKGGEVSASEYESEGQVGKGEEEEDNAEGQAEQENESVEGSYEQDYPSAIPAGTKLFVGNIPFDIDSEGLARIFEEAGIVEMVEVIYNRNTGRSRGFAFVTMSTVEEAEAAIQRFNGSQIGERTVRVNFPEVPRGAGRGTRPTLPSSNSRYVDSPHKIYVGNLAWSVTSDALKSAFDGKGNVLGARVVYDRQTGRSRGFGFVTFSSEAEMEAAVSSTDGVELEGRPMRVNTAQSRPSPYGSPVQNE
uniref:Small ribosomal subunit protein cS22 n=1 Tax=Wollemia nobilis TaxID=56998 RepID=A0A0C9SA73_9CONI